MENIYGAEKRDRKKYKKPIVTIGLIVLNIIFFTLLELLGCTEDSSFMAHYGALFVPYVLEGNQYFRFITSMFMHFGINHLFNNMIMLFCLGEILEKQIGKVSFLTVYLLSGIGANIISFWYYLKGDELVVSAGASGAIFGILGSLLVVVVMNKGKLESITTLRLIFMICLSLYLGYRDINTNNAAHIGGLLFGIILGIILSMIIVFKRKKK
ncbi:rhomboid family intramembrane serine protease [Anaerosacchariphilus polymeriproducens]|uniref:Rhomboid family intramembrane serine protease n=2 Tax=Anaerosacchariphilus polymeriproducens TaxID=1812858 RepID=A0A371B034_9FIRM|nr:rhomboid family intramembrane serine protease [Anaerosacchariphilus polymeriproducens]